MVVEGYITDKQAKEAASSVLDIKPRQNLYIEQVLFYTEHVRRYIEKNMGGKSYTGTDLKFIRL